MRHARYELLEDDGTFYGEIAELPGVWANAATLEACRDEIAEVLEGWVIWACAGATRCRSSMESASSPKKRFECSGQRRGLN
jgi:hypothetical protein